MKKMIRGQEGRIIRGKWGVGGYGFIKKVNLKKTIIKLFVNSPVEQANKGWQRPL